MYGTFGMSFSPLKKTLAFKKKVDDKILFMKIFALQDEMLKGGLRQ